MFRSFRVLLLFILLSYSAISLVTFCLSKIHLHQKTEILNIRQNLREIQTEIYRDFKTQTDFFFYERSNPNFYKTKKSTHFDHHIKSQEHIRHSLIAMLSDPAAKNFGADSTIMKLIDQLMVYSGHFRTMIDVQFKKGFKDFGTIGQMRKYVHDMEKCKEFDLADVLMLRRHEKDYLLRNDLKYSDKLHRKANEVVIKLERKSEIPHQIKDSLRLLLNNYVICFDKVVRYDNEQGFITNTGLKKLLDESQHNIVSLMETLLSQAEKKEKLQLLQLNAFSLILIGAIVLASILLSIWLSKRITFRLTNLSNGMKIFVDSGFDNVPDTILPAKNKDEISQLTNNYLVMRGKIIELVFSFKKKVEERTAEIRFQKEQLEKQAEEIAAQRDRLSVQNKYIEEQKKYVELQNSEILDSLRYASGIQQTMMPDPQELHSVLENVQIVYRPLDIISGDYYWVYKTEAGSPKPSCSFFAVADCTGHGVPGALMSMLGIIYLNEIVISHNTLDPATILELLRENVINSMRYRNSKNKTYDGMDIALGMIDHENKTLLFAGANRDAHIIRNGKMEVLTGDKMPVGRHQGSQDKFKTKSAKLEEGDCIYFFTDGFTDQFGGPENKKYTKRRFKEFLKKICAEQEFSQHSRIIESELNTWQGKQHQIDDISVLGVQWFGKPNDY